MSSETSLLNNKASPVLGYDLEVALNKLKKELYLPDDIKIRIIKLSDLMNSIFTGIEVLNNRLATVENSMNDLDDRVKALEGGS